MSAAVSIDLQGVPSEYLPAVEKTIKALDKPLLRARWAHGWKIPPQAYQPFSLAYLLGFFERQCEELGEINPADFDRAREAVLTKLLGREAIARVSQVLDLISKHEVSTIEAWHTGRKEADAQLGPEASIVCSWREYMYLDVTHYSYSYPRD